MSSKVSFSQIKKNIGLSIIAQIISLAVSFVMNLILPKFISEYQYALCSVLSETVVMKTLSVFDIRNFFGEIIMTVVFVITTILPSQIIGLLIYTMAVAIFIFLNKKNMCYIFKKN